MSLMNVDVTNFFRNFVKSQNKFFDLCNKRAEEKKGGFRKGVEAIFDIHANKGHVDFDDSESNSGVYKGTVTFKFGNYVGVLTIEQNSEDDTSSNAREELPCGLTATLELDDYLNVAGSTPVEAGFDKMSVMNIDDLQDAVNLWFDNTCERVGIAPRDAKLQELEKVGGAPSVRQP